MHRQQLILELMDFNTTHDTENTAGFAAKEALPFADQPHCGIADVNG